MIGARAVGASIRALELAAEFASSRVAFGRAIAEHQGVEFMLVDMAAEISSAKSLLYRTAWQAARGEVSRKQLHGLAAAVKLVCSESAGRVLDRAVQIHGGRGYMRENPVERLYRDIRVDRIWEGSSEIQRTIIGGQIKKRGLAIYTGWVEGGQLEHKSNVNCRAFTPDGRTLGTAGGLGHTVDREDRCPRRCARRWCDRGDRGGERRRLSDDRGVGR